MADDNINDGTEVNPTFRGAKDAVLAGAAGGLTAKVLEGSGKKIAAAAIIPGVIIGGWEYLSANKERNQINGLAEERNALKGQLEQSQKQLGAIEKLTHQDQVAVRREEPSSPDKGRG